MKTSFSAILLVVVFSLSLTAQNNITGTWLCLLDKNEGYDREILTLTDDGYYYGTLYYLNGEAYGIGPDHFFGLYSFDGATLELYDIKNDGRISFPISDLDGERFLLFNEGIGKNFTYQYQGPASMNQNQRENLLSWENFRKLGGTWRSSESVIKVLPSLGIIIIRDTDDPEFFRWGHYIVNGNELTLKEISVEEAVFYTGSILDLDRDELRLLSNGEEEKFRFEGEIRLDADETTMVSRYMQMTHRMNMTAIDAMDGVQDFIWREVDQYGNIKY